MDPFRLAIAALPLGLYCLWVASTFLARRPVLVSGPRDFIVLAAAVAGLVIIGPMELFMPEAAANRFGGYVWLLLIAFYGLAVSLIVMLSRQRIVVYNVTVEQLRPLLAQVAQSLDADARWAGDSLALPTLGVQLSLDNFSFMRNVSIVASSDRQSLEGWTKLTKELRTALAGVKAPFNVRGIGLVAAALALISTAACQMFFHTPELAQAVREMLRL